jgi:hypothetical protein
MRAARLHGEKQDFVLEGVPDPEPFPPFPWTLRHENAGWVAALGPGAEGFVCLGGEERCPEEGIVG